MPDPAPEIDFPPELLDYFAARQRQRGERINRVLATLRPFERRVLREAAVMGYVRGAMAGRARATLGKPRDGDIPTDADILADVIGACMDMDYPYIAAASEGERRRITKSRRWPGE